MIKNLIKFVINWDPKITIYAQITSPKQLVPTEITYKNSLKILEAKSWKNKLLQTTCTKKTGSYFF